MDEATRKYLNGGKATREKREKIFKRAQVLFPSSRDRDDLAAKMYPTLEISQELFSLLEDAHNEIAWLRETFDERKCINGARNGVTCFYDAEKHGDIDDNNKYRPSPFCQTTVTTNVFPDDVSEVTVTIEADAIDKEPIE